MNRCPLHEEEKQEEETFYIGNEQAASDSAPWRTNQSNLNLYYNQQEEKQQGQSRSPSPTSTMMDISDEEDDAQANGKSDSSSCSNTTQTTIHRSVSWRETVVTDVIYRPITQSTEKKVLYYNSADMQRFRQHYKMQVRAAQQYQKKLQKSSSSSEKRNNKDLSTNSSNNMKVTRRQNHYQQQQHLYTNPISGIINVLTAYLSGSSSSQTSLSSSSPNHTSRNSNSLATKGPIAETCVLVDTLYLF